MNLAFVCTSRFRYCTKARLRERAIALGRRGHGVHIFAADPRLLESCWDRDLTVHPIGFAQGPTEEAAWQFARLFQAHRIAVACLPVAKDLATAGLAARWLGIRVVRRTEDLAFLEAALVRPRILQAAPDPIPFRSPFAR